MKRIRSYILENILAFTIGVATLAFAASVLLVLHTLRVGHAPLELTATFAVIFSGIIGNILLLLLTLHSRN